MADRPSEADLVIQSTALQILALLRTKYSKGGCTVEDFKDEIARAMDAQIEKRAEKKLDKATKARRSSAPSLSSDSALCEER
ncbi:Hypothetical predicted protein [Lecanosticta acicola]|uniref:Uncharacterized protein n=1 Tax=Lecanosticta acicola TaxID=111012 RepID=A0AAI8YX93_9PEZI|nr:Hypothetical predicted protein [Lecanosticta acicola]